MADDQSIFKNSSTEIGREQLERVANMLPSYIDDLPTGIYDSLLLQDLQVDHVEHGRLLCTIKVPPRLLNIGNFLHGGVIAAYIDLMGSAVIFTTGAKSSGVTVEINVSYLAAAKLGEEIEIEAKVLRVGKTIAFVTVDVKKKKTGELIAQGRHTKYLAVTSKL